MSATNALYATNPSTANRLFAMGQVAPFQSAASSAHVETFNNLVGYLVRLRRDGTLDESDFSVLVKMATAMFIEAQISGKVGSILDKALENSLPVIR